MVCLLPTSTVMMKNIFILISFLGIFANVKAQQLNLSGVVNNYTAVTHIVSSCRVRVSTPQLFFQGQPVMLIQMKGADINKTNTSSFGDLTNLNNAGRYELNYIDSIWGDTVSFVNSLQTTGYDVSSSVQMISVPTADFVHINGNISALPWDPFQGIGGIVVIEARDSMLIEGDINVSNIGYFGGIRSAANYTCSVMHYGMNVSGQINQGGLKGESMVNPDLTVLVGRGAYLTGGGGGNNHNSGGGGGANGGRGGLGGKQSFINTTNPNQGCYDTITHNGGIGGKPFDLNNYRNRMFPGSGGGGGHMNDAPSAGGGIGGKGGNGGGLIFLISPRIHALNAKLIADGQNVDTVGGRDGSGGGGAGGSVVLLSSQVTGNLNVSAKGGRGGDNRSHNNLGINLGGTHGTGGGGGGGYIALIGTSVPSSLTYDLSGGRAGRILNSNSFHFNTTYGASSGDSGLFVYDFQLVRGNPPCVPIVIDAVNDSARTGRNIPVVIPVTTNDRFNRPVNITLCRQARNGIALLSGTTEFTYTPNNNFLGKDSFTYCMCTQGQVVICDSAIVYIEVSIPQVRAFDDIAIGFIGTNLNIPVLGNDSVNVPVNITIITPPVNGAATPSGNQVGYIPLPNFAGLDSFEYEICSQNPPIICDKAWVRITVRAAVEANDDFVNIGIGQTVNIRVRDNDTALLPTQIAIITPPRNGIATVTPALGWNSQVNYVPAANFAGIDSFQYLMCSTSPIICDTAWVYINIQPRIVAVDDVSVGFINRPQKVRVSNNDTLFGSYNLTMISAPIHGTGSFTTNDTFLYLPNLNSRLSDSITYVLCSSSIQGLCDTAKVYFNLFSQIITVEDSTTTPLNTSVRINVRTNDVLVELSDLSIVTSPSRGTNSRIGNDSVLYTPNNNFIGSDSFKYCYCTRALPRYCDTNWVKIRVIGFINNPPIAVFDTATTTRNRPRLIPVLDNDFEPDGDSLSLYLLGQPLNGNSQISGNQILYTPNNNFIGNDRFRYFICDQATPALCDTTDVFVSILERGGLFIPTGISPNNDGSNDTWIIRGLDLFGPHRIEILNRWGNVVWFTENYDQLWNGVNSNGEPLPDGTYYYVIIFEQDDTIFRGFITVQRTN